MIGSTDNWARGVALWNLALDEKGGPHKGGCGNCGAWSRSTRRPGHTRATSSTTRSRTPASSCGRGLIGSNPRARIHCSRTSAFLNPDRYTKVLLVLNTAKEARSFVVRFRSIVPVHVAAGFGGDVHLGVRGEQISARSGIHKTEAGS